MKPILWRDAIRDSDLDSTAKLVAHTLSTYMNGAGVCWPSKSTLAQGAGKSKRTVDGAIERLASAGFLTISQSRGRSSNGYTASNPTMHLIAGFGLNRAASDAQTCSDEHLTVQSTAPESDLKSIEGVRPSHSETDEERKTRAKDLRKNNRHLLPALSLREMPE